MNVSDSLLFQSCYILGCISAFWWFFFIRFCFFYPFWLSNPSLAFIALPCRIYVHSCFQLFLSQIAIYFLLPFIIFLTSLVLSDNNDGRLLCFPFGYVLIHGWDLFSYALWNVISDNIKEIQFIYFNFLQWHHFFNHLFFCLFSHWETRQSHLLVWRNLKKTWKLKKFVESDRGAIVEEMSEAG